MHPSKSFVVRLVIYSAALLFIAGDLFVFHGPLRKKIDAMRPDSPESIARAKSRGVVARVFGHVILQSQVERAARERLWLRGMRIEDLRPEQRRIERLAALNDLIDHQLLRVKVMHNSIELPVADEEIDEAVKRLASRFASRDEMKSELEAEGIDSEKELRYRLAARIQQSKYLESRIEEGVSVSEEEAREWYAEHKESLAVPERVKVRHVFLATLNRGSEEARGALEAALADLKAGNKKFAQLAAELSEDARNKGAGGELGWMTLDRLPADFGEPVFAMPVGKPQLLRTKIGWHLVEVQEKRGRELRSFEEAREEVMVALESAKRKEMVLRFRQALRAQERESVQVFTDMISGE